MNRLNKLLLSFVLPIFCLLINVSHAIPENYFFTNFLIGSSFWSYSTNVDRPNYYPSTTGSNIYSKGVVSFNNSKMLGDEYETALNVVNLDSTTGKKITIAPGEMLVVTSFSGQADSLSIQGSLNYVVLGSSIPYLYNGSGALANNDMIGPQIKTTSTSYLTASTSGFTTEYSRQSDSFLQATNMIEYQTIVDSSLSLKTTFANQTYNSNGSFVYWLANTSSYNSYISLDSTTIDLSDLGEYSVEKDNITDPITYSLHTFAISGNAPYVLIPNLNANIDIYFDTTEYVAVSDSETYYISGISNILGYVSFNTKNTLAISCTTSDSMFTSSSITKAMMLQNDYSDYAPIFLNRLYGQYRYAIQVNGGYISIDNYDELIEKLKEAGFGSSSGGSSDLTRVIELLEDINTGGETGEEVKELIGILEEYHHQLQNQANFGSATGIFDTYKNILEFTSDMHWLITANNALFEYFAGFIMMCAMFLFLSRVMR